MPQTFTTYTVQVFILAPQVTLFIHKVVIWFKMVSLQPVKPTIISFLCPQFKPTIDICKPLYKSNVVNVRVVYITYTMATQDLSDIYAQAREPATLRLGNIYISGKSRGHGITIKYQPFLTAV